jgi:hypothetical protein
MGGSGPKWTPSMARDDAERLRREETASVSTTYDVEVNGYLGGLLQAYNDRDAVSLATHLEQIQAALENALEADLTLKMGGSIAKKTYVEGFSDVDALVMLDETALSDGTPNAARRFLADRLKRRFTETEVLEGDMAVTVRFRDMDIQLLPALKSGSAVKLSSPGGRAWALIEPRAFTRRLTALNGELSGKLVPTIKLAKAMIYGLPESQRLSGYHVESLAVRVFAGYEGPRTLRAMTRHFFEAAAEAVLRPMTDKTGQSGFVDSDLGAAKSVARRVVRDAFSRIGRRMANADGAGEVGAWERLFEA